MFPQNQQGTSPNKWDRSGIVVESPRHGQYRVKVDGSGCLTLRSCHFLHAYFPAPPSSCCLWSHPHYLALGIRPTFFHAPTTLPGATPLSQAPASSDVSLNAPTATSSNTALALEHPVTWAVVPETLSPPLVSPCPCSERRLPKHFEPKTGLWVPRRVHPPMLAYSFPD